MPTHISVRTTLPIIIRRMREQIIASGGEVHFACRMEELILERGEVRGVVCSGGRAFHGPVLLATGHSARDVYRYLHRAEILIEAKPIAVGVRLEHPQSLIDEIRYHSPEGRGKYLPAAEYVYKAQAEVGECIASVCVLGASSSLPPRGQRRLSSTGCRLLTVAHAGRTQASS